MITRGFIKGAAERAAKTFLQAFVAVIVAGIGADAVGVTAGVADVDWLTALSVAALATVLSLATSIGNASFTAGVTPEAGPPIRSTSTVVEYATDGDVYDHGDPRL